MKPIESFVATHRVSDDEGHIVGCMVSGRFLNKYNVLSTISKISNLYMKNGVVKTNDSLPIIPYKDIIDSYYKQLKEENPLERDIQTEFLKWKSRLSKSSHPVLQLEGSRQVGKTTELLKFAYKNYKNIIYVNIAIDRYKFLDTVINTDCSMLSLIEYCQIANIPPLIARGYTILILDEIQSNVTVYNSIRDLNKNLDCDIAITGSYLGHILQNTDYFIPAGTIWILKMHSLSFSEFCKVSDSENLLNNIDLFGASTDEEYNKLNELYNIYKQIGGYPQVVNNYVDTHDIGYCSEIIGNLLVTFRNESATYLHEKAKTDIFEDIYEAVIELLLSSNKATKTDILKDVELHLSKNYDTLVKKQDIYQAVKWIILSGVAGTCNLYVEGNVHDVSRSRRLYFNDCGLANYIMTTLELSKDTVSGLLTEHFAYNELVRMITRTKSKKVVRNDKPYFSTYGNYELDFMLSQINRGPIGIEVKTTRGNPKSLKVYKSKGFIKRAILAKPSKGGHGDYFDTIPIFAIGARFPYE